MRDRIRHQRAPDRGDRWLLCARVDCPRRTEPVGATIRASLELDNATLVAKERPALRAPKLTVAGDVTLGDEATVIGAVDLSSATVDGRLLLKYRVDDDHKSSISDCHVNTLHLEILPAE